MTVNGTFKDAPPGIVAVAGTVAVPSRRRPPFDRFASFAR
jgi:hypothetical protein